MDKIILNGLKLFGKHGCIKFERETTQPFLVDLVLYADFTEAIESDDINCTIDYTDIIDDIKKIFNETSYNLIETLAEKICDSLLEKYLRLKKVIITLHKVSPLVSEEFSDVAVQIARGKN